VTIDPFSAGALAAAALALLVAAWISFHRLHKRGRELEQAAGAERERAARAEETLARELADAKTVADATLKRAQDAENKAEDAEKKSREAEVQIKDLRSKYQHEHDELVITESEFQEQKRDRSRIEGELTGYKTVLVPAYRKDRLFLKDTILQLASIARARASARERHEIEEITRGAEIVVETVHDLQRLPPWGAGQSSG
jgi:membrane-bound lytic murein transglycosylase